MELLKTQNSLVMDYMGIILTYPSKVVYVTNICGNNKNLKGSVKKAMSVLTMIGFGDTLRTQSKSPSYKFVKTNSENLCPESLRDDIRELNIPFPKIYGLFIDFEE